MDNNSPYLWNAPEGADNQSIDKIQSDRLDEILQAPVTGEDIAYRYSRAMQEKRNPNLTFDEFKMYDDWHKQQEINWWEVATSGAGMFFSDIGKGLASLQPFGKGNSFKEASLNLTTRLGPTAAEALARGTRDLVGMAKIASENQNSPFYRLFNPNGDVYTRYLDFNSLTDWNITSQKLVDGDENVLLPNTSKMIGKDVSLLDPAYLFQVNTALAHAGSYFLDPIALATMGSSSVAKTGLTVAAKGGAKGGAKAASEVLMKSALKEGITGAESAARNTATIMDKGRILGAGVTEKIGKSFRVAGELVDRPINLGLDWIKKQADELFDTNLHQTVNGNLRVTGPVKGQAGFGGSLMAGIGLGSIGLPMAGLIVPVWATAQAARIGGSFFEAIGKEMVGGVGVLGRVGKQAGSAGKLARTFEKWGPMGDYVKELSKATAKSAVYGTGIGYAVGGEEGAAQGLGMGAAIGTTHYHWGVAENLVKGQSREKMTVDLVNNINSLREKGFTKKADTVLKYLEEIRAQHGDDKYFRNLGWYLGLEADDNVVTSIWDKEDYLRLANDPSVDPQVRQAINEVIAGGDPERQGQGWNGLFMGRKGDNKPYFIHKDSQSGKTHVIINAWAIDNTGKTQATGLKGEFFHVLADAYKEASTKERFKEEVFEGLVRTLGADHTPEGRAKMAEMLRNAANNLSVFGGDLKAQNASKRAKNLLKVHRKNAPAGWKAEFVMGNEVVVEGSVKRPPLYWETANGWRIQESNGRYELSGRVEGKFVRKEYASLNEAVRDHKLFAPIDNEVKSTAQTRKPKTPKAEFEAKAGPRAGEREGFDANIADMDLTNKATEVIDILARKIHGKSAKEFLAQDKATFDIAVKGYRQALADGWIFDETKVDASTKNDGFSHPDYPNAKLSDFYDESGNRRTSQGTIPPNAAGERTAVKPEAPQSETPKQKSNDGEYTPEQIESIYRQIDDYEKTGNLNDGKLATLIEEMGESVWDAHENDMPFDYVYLAGDLGVARNLIEELKHRFSRMVDRNARQAGFVPDFSKDFVDWFKDKDGKAIVDPYMRDLYKKFLGVHKNRKSNLNFYNVDYNAFSPSALKTFVEENQIEHEYDKDPATGNYVRKSDETINRESHQRHQAAYRDLLAAEKAGIDTGFHIYALEKDAPDIGHLDEENSAGTMKQQAWRQYRTTVDDIKQAQRKGTIPTREELQDAIKNANFGRRGRPRTGEIDDVVATAEKGSIIFSGVPTVEGFKILQKHLAKGEMASIAQVAPLVLDGGLTQPNVLRIKYAGFEHAPEEGPMLKRSKNTWTATEKNMVFYGMELRGTLRNLKTGKFDYKRPQAHFLVHGVDIDVLQRRIQHMWSKEKETRKRWATMVDFEKDVYRLIENYSMKTAIAGSRFFGGGAEGKAKKRLACAAIGAFPTRDMVGGLDGDEGDFEMPEIDWHHYQFRAYGKGNQGRDIPWTALRGEGIKKVYGTNDTMRVPYAERAYYRAQEMFQAASKKPAREGEDSPANMRFVSQELQGGRVTQILTPQRPSGDWVLREKGYTPNDVIKSIVNGQFKLSPEKAQNALDFVKGGIGHDEATNSALVFWHWSGSGVPFESIEQGQIGMHIGTREAALYRAMKVAQETGIDPVSVADNTFPVIVNMKKPLTLMDRGSWSPDDIVDAIMYANLENDIRAKTQQPRVESFYERQLLDNVARTVGPLTNADMQFLKAYKLSLAANKINAGNAFLAQAEMAMNKGQTPAFEAMSKRMYKAAEPLHKWLSTKGVDGIRYRNSVEGSSWSYIAFSGKNVKHLVKNTGEFSPQSLSLMRQEASRFGARNADDASMLESNYRQAIKEGDVFRAISIKDNFLRDMPVQTKVIRQTADEAIKQGMSPEQYNSQFATGTPAVFPVLKGEKNNAWSSHMTLDMDATNSMTSRALVKTKNPLVIDASGLALESRELDANSWIQKAQDSKNDAVIFTNTNDGINGNRNQTIVFGNNNIAVTDMNIARESVPRGAGLINDVSANVPFRQETNVKRTFYSAVEKFVEEKVTEKTPLDQLLGLMDPAKGTGLTKAELTWLDIQGWVDRQRETGVKKVDRQGLLDYIRANKIEVQESDPATVKGSLSTLTPEQQIQAQNNAQIQQVMSTSYSGFTVGNHPKEYDDQKNRNYRVFILRGPVDAVYGTRGHFAPYENVIGHLRTTDKFLLTSTETTPPEYKRGVYPEYRGNEYQYMIGLNPDETKWKPDSSQYDFEQIVSRANYNWRDFIEATEMPNEFAKQLTQDNVNDVVDRLYTAPKAEYQKEQVPHLEISIPAVEKLGDFVYSLGELNEDYYARFSSLINNIFAGLPKPSGTFHFESLKMLTSNRGRFRFNKAIEYLAKADAPAYVQLEGGKNDAVQWTTNAYVGTSKETIRKGLEKIVSEIIAIKEENGKELQIVEDKRLKILFGEEVQSDTGQEVEGIRKEARTAEEDAFLESERLRINKTFADSRREYFINKFPEYAGLERKYPKHVIMFTEFFELPKDITYEQLTSDANKWLESEFDSEKVGYPFSKKSKMESFQFFEDKLQEFEGMGKDEALDFAIRIKNIDGNSPLPIQKGKDMSRLRKYMGAEEYKRISELLGKYPVGSILTKREAKDVLPKSELAEFNRVSEVENFLGFRYDQVNSQSVQKISGKNSDLWQMLVRETQGSMVKKSHPYDLFWETPNTAVDYSVKEKTYPTEMSHFNRVMNNVDQIIFSSLKDMGITDDGGYNLSDKIYTYSAKQIQGLVKELKDRITLGDWTAEGWGTRESITYLGTDKTSPKHQKLVSQFESYYKSIAEEIVGHHRFEDYIKGLIAEKMVQSKPHGYKGLPSGISKLLPDHPFEKTDQWVRLLVRKMLRVAVEEKYDGIQLVPSELPQLIVGGEGEGQKYFYEKIVPKIINQELKKFGMQLRTPKSFKIQEKAKVEAALAQVHDVARTALSYGFEFDDTYAFMANLIESTEGKTFGAIQYEFAGSRGDYYQSRGIDSGPYVSTIASKLKLSDEETRSVVFDKYNSEHLDALASAITFKTIDTGVRKGIAKYNRGLLDIVLTTMKGKNNEPSLIFSSIEDNGTRNFIQSSQYEVPASNRGYIALFSEAKNPQKINDVLQGLPMYQAASRKPRKPKAEGQAETVGEVRGLGDGTPIPKKDRSIGEREEGSPIPEIPKDTAESVRAGIDNTPASAVDKRLAIEGVADYRGYKIIYDKANGGYRVTDPAGKTVMIPTVYRDKFTGEQVVKSQRTVMFPQDGVDLIDHLLGGMPKKTEVATPPLAKPATPQQQQVVATAERAIPKSGEASSATASNEMSIVQSQLEATGRSKYYLYNIEFDNKTGEYMAKDNAGQPISVTIDSPFQSGPAMVTSIRTKSLESLLGGLDKKFDKAKFARLAPRASTSAGSQTQAPVAPAPVAPAAPVNAPTPPEPVEPPKRRVPASSVPPAVASAPTTKPTPKPKDKPQPKPNVNKPKPKVVMPVEPVAKDVGTAQTAQPVEVVSDKEYMDRQAKAMGKGFIAMMKDPDMAQYIIDSLNIDDNLTLKGDSETASTADGRFSVNRKGKKYIITQNNYESPITGLKYDKRTIAYVNTIDQAQMLIRRLEVERNMGLKARNMPMENPLMVMAAENPAFEDMARQKAIRDNAFIMMLLSMRDQGITPIYIDPNTLQPILVMMPSEEAIAQVTRPSPRQQPNIGGLLPENGSQERLLPAILDEAIKFDYVMDAQITQMAKTKKDIAERYMNSLGYEILKFQGKFRLFNPLKNAVSVRDDEDAIMNDLIRDIAKKGIPR